MTSRIHDILRFLHEVERLKSVTRHSWTSSGRHESVPEHTWRMALLAMVLREELPEIDAGRVIEMTLVHDLGETYTGDTPNFGQLDQQAKQRQEEEDVRRLIAPLSPPTGERILALWREFHACETPEARLANALDKLEVIIQHDEADLSTWLPLEYDLNLEYGREFTEFHDFIREFRRAVDEETRRKRES